MPSSGMTPALERSGRAASVAPMTLQVGEGVVHPGDGGGLLGELRRAFRGESDEDGVEEHGGTAGELEVGLDQFAVGADGAADLGSDDLEVRLRFSAWRP